MSRRLLLAGIIVAGCGDSPVDLPALPEVSRPRGATAAAFVLDLAGHGDLLAAGLDGGVALWDLSSGASRRVTRIDGLPSDHVPALALDERAEGLLAATRSGLARDWWEGPWTSAFTSRSDCDREFTACAARPGGGWVAGTTSGLLVAWTATRPPLTHVCSSLRVVTTSARVEPSAAARSAESPVIPLR